MFQGAYVTMQENYVTLEANPDNQIEIQSDGVNGEARVILGGVTFLLARIVPSPSFADDVAAAAGGVAIGVLYHTNGAVKIRMA